jgi:subtilisin family serine protease
VAGVAFECSIMPVKVLDANGGGTLQEVVDGIYYAVDHSADVINMSLSWSSGYDPGQPLKYALEYAYDNGVTVVCSSGNEGAGTVNYPAAYWTTIAVGATRYDETRSDYSNYGSALDLMAPGGDLSVDQNGDGYGDGILQNTFSPLTKNPRSFSYWFFDGTSMAAPHVSGVAALLIANGTVGPDDIRYALKSTAEDKGAAGWDSQYGWGIVDAYAALNAPPNEDRKFTLSDSQLMAFDDTYVTPRPWFADLTEKSDPEGLGVEYDVTLYGAWGIEIGVGGAPPQADLSGYSDYTLTFTNTSVDDSYNVNLYVKTGAGETYYGSGWSMMFPGRQKTLSLNLSSIPDINDVREIGFGFGAWVGSAYGYADAIRVKVERIHSE